MMSAKVLVFAVFLLLFNSVVAGDFQVTITDDGPKGSQIHRKIGKQLSMNCSAIVPNDFKHVVIKWLKNGNLISSSNTTNGWFVKKLSNLSISDGGYYKCEASYDGLDPKSAGVFVNIEEKPRIIKCCDRKWFTGKPVWVLNGAQQDLKCFATGWPMPDLKWFYNGIELKQQTGQEKGTYKLESEQNGLILKIYGMVKQDEGKYTCEASNRYGKDTNVYKVTVLGPAQDPEVGAVQSHINTNIGQPNITLMCIGKGVRELDADTKWFYNGKELKENKTHLAFLTHYYDQKAFGVTRKVKMELTIFNVTQSDHGNYTCKVYVADKSVNATISLAVKKSDSNKPKSRDPEMLPLRMVIALAVVGSVVIVSGIVAIVVFYRSRRRKVDPPKIPKGLFKYGAFITYSSQDYAWVQANLLPLLKDNDIEACIHYRNFDVGVLLEQNMVNCVYSSRVVIVIMSKNYMKSKYCRSELDYAIHRSTEEPDSNPLIALKIDKTMKDKELPSAIRKKTFIDVTNEVEKDNWKQRLLMHVKGKEGDQNKNVMNNKLDNPVDDENAALMDPE